MTTLTQPTLVGALFALLVPLAITAAAATKDRIVGGKWESAMTTEGETHAVAYCISPAEASSINGDSKTGRDFAEKKAGSRCGIKSYEITGDTVSYTLTCGTRTITDRTVFHGETSEGIKTASNEGKTVTTSLKSRRVGVCP